MMNRNTYTVQYVQTGHEYMIFIEARSMEEAWDLAYLRLPQDAEICSIDETSRMYQE